MFALDDVGDISSNIVLSPTPQRAVLNPKAETLEPDYDEANPKANFVALGTGSSSRRLVAGTGSIDLVNVSDDDYCDSCPSDSSDSGYNISRVRPAGTTRLGNTRCNFMTRMENRR